MPRKKRTKPLSQRERRRRQITSQIDRLSRLPNQTDQDRELIRELRSALKR